MKRRVRKKLKVTENFKRVFQNIIKHLFFTLRTLLSVFKTIDTFKKHYGSQNKFKKTYKNNLLNLNILLLFLFTFYFILFIYFHSHFPKNYPNQT